MFIEGVTTHWGEEIKPNKVTTHDVNKRLRLGTKSQDEDGMWFNYEDAKTKEDFEEVATNVLSLLNTSDVHGFQNH